MKTINQIKTSLKKDGFVYLPEYLKNSKSLNLLISDIRKVLMLRNNNVTRKIVRGKSINNLIKSLNENNEKNIAFVNDVMNASPSLHNLFNDPKILSIVKKLIKSNNSYLCVNNYKFRIQVPGRDEMSNLPWHQDSHYNTMSDKNTSIVAWVSLSNIAKKQGPIIFKCGSHKLGKTKKFVKKRKNGNKIFTVSNQIVSSKKYKEVSYPSKIGDVILIDMNVVHTSGVNKSIDLSKLSAQARFHQAGNKNFLNKYNV
tara:strand:+ start:287 stop:1054 length:768 start_codon:yes stop_codon:yes gene_type:complete